MIVAASTYDNCLELLFLYQKYVSYYAEECFPHLLFVYKERVYFPLLILRVINFELVL